MAHGPHPHAVPCRPAPAAVWTPRLPAWEKGGAAAEEEGEEAGWGWERHGHLQRQALPKQRWEAPRRELQGAQRHVVEACCCCGEAVANERAAPLGHAQASEVQRCLANAFFLEEGAAERMGSMTPQRYVALRTLLETRE